LGLRVAESWLTAGETVYGMTRSTKRAAELERRGLRPIVADITGPASLQLPPADTVLYAVGYDPRSGVSRRDLHVAGFRRLLDALPATVERLIFISTTGVYGQSGGEWVDEDSACVPAGESGKVYLEAEQMLFAHPSGTKAVVLRLAGLYGPSRVPQRDRIASGNPLPAGGWLNLIQVEDAAQVVLDAERLAVPPRVYCVSDGHPVLRRDYYEEVARLWNVPAPRLAFTEEGPSSSRGSSNKRVSNQRMVRDLKTILKHKDYKHGLSAISVQQNSSEF
jgi:nucleoside-diphosphate-sugar epimerase